ncbi:MAG: serine/threonine protein kinase [Verrucomicrobiales bacterium]|nr:serine/threonine protein kinase [Verrucomicrobiales bacterium]|tara:strand:- start:1355 stop:2620 length:1266 start_codon:yes stop_codon:yes gene_type:complete
MKTASLTLSISFLISCVAFANWPQFRGDNAQGISLEAVPVEWSESENMVWKVDLEGEGSSSPIISGGAVFVTSYSGSGENLMRHLQRIDLYSGDVVWTRDIPNDFPIDPARGYITEHGWASNTPVTDGEAIFGYFGKAGVYAFDYDGNQLWKARTGGMSSAKVWGSASSPILYDDLVIVPAGEETNSFIALSKADGSERWRAKHPSLGQTYGTPILAKVGGSRTDLIYAATGNFRAYDPATGELRWFANYNLPGNMSNTTHLSGDILTVSGGFPRTARVAIKAGGEGDRSNQILYDTQKPATYMTAPVEVDGIMYWIADSGITFAAKPGEAEELWAERLPGLEGAGGRGKPFYASPVVAGGKIYAVSRANGTFVIEPSPDRLNVLSQNKIAGDSTLFNGTAAVADGKLLIRSQQALYCIGE